MTRQTTAAVALACAAFIAAGCGGDDGAGSEAAGDLRWAGPIDVVRPASLPDDVIVSGEVTNDTLKPVKLEAASLRVEDAEGRRVPAVAVFSRSWSKPIIPFERDGPLPEAEEYRIGVRAFVAPGKRVPLTVAWRRSAGSGKPVRISYGAGWLSVPDRAPEVVEGM